VRRPGPKPEILQWAACLDNSMALCKTYLQAYLIDGVTNVPGKAGNTRVVWLSLGNVGRVARAADGRDRNTSHQQGFLRCLFEAPRSALGHQSREFFLIAAQRFAQNRQRLGIARLLVQFVHPSECSVLNVGSAQ